MDGLSNKPLFLRRKEWDLKKRKKNYEWKLEIHGLLEIDYLASVLFNSCCMQSHVCVRERDIYIYGRC